MLMYMYTEMAEAFFKKVVSLLYARTLNSKFCILILLSLLPHRVLLVENMEEKSSEQQQQQEEVRRIRESWKLTCYLSCCVELCREFKRGKFFKQ